MYRLWASSLLLLLIAAGSAFGFQEAKLKGTVRAVQGDGSKLPLAGAQVTVEGMALTASGNSITTTTDEEGRFFILSLPPGDYTLRVNVPGFENYMKQFKSLPGSVGEFEVDLKIVDTPSDIVEVKADTPTIDRTDSSSSGEVRARVIRNAPLAEERFQETLPLVPGVVRGPDGLINIKGARSSQSGLLVNSTNVTDPVTGNFAINLPIEAIESISVLSSPYSAEYGKFTGAVTSIGTRAGGNKFRFLFTNFTPRFRRRMDDQGNSKIVGIESFTPRLILTGPIIKDKLTISQSLEYRFVRTRVPSLPDLKNDTKIETFDSFTQLDYTVNAKNKITSVISIYPQNLSFVNLNTFNDMEVTPNFRQRGFFVSVADRAVFSSGGFLESIFSVKRFNAFIFPQGNNGMIIGAEENDGNFFNRQSRFTTRYDAQATYSFPIINAKGSHAVKAGFVSSYNTFNGRDTNSTIQVFRGNRSLSQFIDFVGDGRIKRNNFEQSVFIQDKYTINPKVIFDIGLRYDYTSLAEQQNFAPRFGFLFSPFDDGKTVIRGGVGLFYDKVQLGAGVFEQMQSRRVTSFATDGQTIIDRRLFQNRIDDGDLDAPYSYSTTLQIDRELIKNLFFRLGLEKREGFREFIIEPGSDQNGSTILLSNGGRSSYTELQLTTRYKLTDEDQVTFSYVRSRAFGDLNDFNSFFGNFRNPIIRANQRGRQPFDAPNRFLVSGTLGLPFDLVASPVLDVRNGFPFSVIDGDQNFVGRRQDFRLPRFLSLDLQLTKGIAIPVRGKKYRTRVGVKVFNITNHFNPRDAQSNVDSVTFGSFFNSVGRTFRGKFEFDF